MRRNFSWSRVNKLDTCIQLQISINFNHRIQKHEGSIFTFILQPPKYRYACIGRCRKSEKRAASSFKTFYWTVHGHFGIQSTYKITDSYLRTFLIRNKSTEFHWVMLIDFLDWCELRGEKMFQFWYVFLHLRIGRKTYKQCCKQRLGAATFSGSFKHYIIYTCSFIFFSLLSVGTRP